jgi:hypothetical protein
MYEDLKEEVAEKNSNTPKVQISLEDAMSDLGFKDE